MPRATNTPLTGARRKRDDEFYTPRGMIEAELEHYSPALFRGKRILCNCDDPDYSEFFRYFADNFTALKLRRLVGLRYSGSTLPYADDPRKAGTWRAARYQVPADAATPSFKRTLFADKNGKKRDTGRCFLPGDTGGFDDREGRRQLADCDIVVTNPPFSRWRDFIAMLAKSKKKFLVIGNLNAVGYKEIFPLIQSGKVWLGAGSCKGAFIGPGGGESKLGFAVWYTNLPHSRRERKEIPLTAKYSARDYPRYDNYPAIEVGRVKDIPADYAGVMGVPLSFLNKWNPEQFEILGVANSARWIGYECFTRIQGRAKYDRLMIRRAGAAADWKETKDLERRSTFGNAGGFVYVAVIPGNPGLFKIGKTNTSVNDRVKREAFSPEKPKVVMALEVANAGMAEKQIHDALRHCRKKGTEFFNPPREELEQELSRLAQKPVRLWRE
ncbi:MAG: adenine-specific methyltransferase EcoRI family protein [Gammaproteobacteria bacterium]